MVVSLLLLALAAVLLLVSAAITQSLLLGAVAVVVAALGALLPLFRGVSLHTVGRALVLLAVATMPWNAVSIGPAQVSDLLLSAGVLTLLAESGVKGKRFDVQIWSIVLASGVLTIGVLHEIFPASSSYLASRYTFVPASVTFGGADFDPPDNLINTTKWLIAVVGVPLAAVLASDSNHQFVGELVRFWVIGTTLSAAAAITDALNLTKFSAGLLPLVDVGGRQAGLAGQVNQLAVSVAIAVPLLIWLAFERGASRYSALLPILLAGSFLSGSRGGFVSAIAALVLSLGVSPRGRALIGRPSIVLLSAYVTGLFVILGVAAEGSSFSLFGRDAENQQDSDSQRLQLLHQGVADFFHDPVLGVGLNVITDAHNIYVQMLASGGVIILVFFFIYLLLLSKSAWDLHRCGFDIPRFIMVSVLVWLVTGAIENQLTDRNLYVPIACLAVVASLANPRQRRGFSMGRQSAGQLAA